MGRSRYEFGNKDAPHFLTDSVVNWLPLFMFPPLAEVILDSFAFLRKEEGLQLHGYVIMEDHLHWIASHPDLPRAVQRFKSFTARRIIDQLQQEGPPRLLRELAFARKDHKIDSRFQLWQEGSHPQMMQGPDMLRQKLDYMHHNPVRRGLIDEPAHWRYSSARNYADQTGLIDIDRIS